MLQVREIQANEHKTLYSHMKRDFPANELPPAFAVKRNLKKAYTAFFLQDEGEDVGYIVTIAPKDLEFALINFFSIFPEHRSKGYGSRFIPVVAENLGGRPFILEVESPRSAKAEEQYIIRHRRIEFYKRLGFVILPTKKAKIFGVNMKIMSNTDKEIKNVRELMHSLYRPTFSSPRWLRFIDVVDATK